MKKYGVQLLSGNVAFTLVDLISHAGIGVNLESVAWLDSE